MNLIVDIGNTRVKLAVFDGGVLVRECSVDRVDDATLKTMLGGARAERAILSTTRDGVDEIKGLVRAHAEYYIEFTPSTPVPIANSYLTPATLGRDRLAAAVGAATIYKGRNVLVVDFGTALTIDLVSANGTFSGGVISPGVAMRFRALSDYTSRLPLCAPCDDEGVQGLTTEEAIRWGVMNSVSFEVEGYIGRMGEKFDDLCVIFTGGDANLFVKRIKNAIFANCNLVLLGLDRILEYNAREEYLD